MSAPVNYPALTDEETLWATRADAEAFFNNFNVSDATTSVRGVVKKSTAPVLPLPAGTITEDYYEIKSVRGDGSIQLDATVVTQAAYQDLADKYADLLAHLQELETNLIAAGVLNS